MARVDRRQHRRGAGAGRHRRRRQRQRRRRRPPASPLQPACCGGGRAGGGPSRRRAGGDGRRRDRRGRVDAEPGARGEAPRPTTRCSSSRGPRRGPRCRWRSSASRSRTCRCTFTLDDSMAMSPAMKISSFPDVVVAARVSKSGNAMPQAGDLEGTSKPVKLGASGARRRHRHHAALSPAARRCPAHDRGSRMPVADVVVIGAGISGLTAAFRLQQRGLAVEVLEAGERAGGVIGTTRRDGSCSRPGPTARSTRRPLIGALLADLGIAGERRDASAVAATRFIVRDGALVALPTSPRAFLTTARVLARRQAARCCASRSSRRRRPASRNRSPRSCAAAWAASSSTTRSTPSSPASTPAIRSASRCRRRFRGCSRWSRNTAA